MATAVAGHGTPATALIVRAKVPHTLHPYDHDLIDASAGDWETVYVSAGRRGLQVALAPTVLVRLAGATVAPLAS